MKLDTSYMGLALKNPIIAGASPLTASVDSIKRLEDAGAAAIILHSIFEEQINHESHEIDHFLFKGSESYAEAIGYFPDMTLTNLESHTYLEEIASLKKSLSIPLIASLNGVSKGGWIEYAGKLQEAGADGLELNITYIPTDTDMDGMTVEKLYLDALQAVIDTVNIPVSIKMNAIFSSPASMAKQFSTLGAKGLVLFDRPVHVDIDLEELTARQTIHYSTSADISESLRWTAILYKKLASSLCISTGVHTNEDVLKAMMSGADAVQMASALLKNGESYITTVLEKLTQWMEEKEYISIEQMKGSISLHHTVNPAAYQRANYMRLLTEYRY
ncbi:MAG TPA: dihydroorotate dehydrogenase-like protein [Sulfurovum sp.]|nr:MAG: dihydroorotate dehydrogenase [Sulfurovum sp. 35-42-20]OYZ25282.1 MAG: dihydroorotate dehydrogenase [Sulfurovum sp. 16-42-52]OYZ48445.1 MAG: dihydroorotate dehydrogenase [Sulfurovum sp. 24-42-9]OZA44106.1 MAG: dihydroorotate dehydrogenase [Sulfurovum sp. 17-42-90]OZA60981.1 MAG: dihydroorotate dehydrogenase [Sulfurovum sp. 39-42-12]HQR74427.1 dihydroorotate dehydrogenase-like protein [Sulfurovum sp.]